MKRLGLLAIWVIVLVGVLPAGAHGYIVRAIPEDRVSLSRAPTRLQYWFSESLEAEFSKLYVWDQNGELIAEGAVDADDNTLLAAQLPADLPDGAYIVELRPAFASDGHVVVETRVFFVGEEVGGVESQAASDQAIPLEVVWRALIITASSLLFGVFALYSAVLVPAWGSSKYPAGSLPPRVISRLNQIVILALVLAVLGSVVSIIQQTMVFFNVDAGQVISRGLWQVVRIGSRFGDVWSARLFLLILIGLGLALTQYTRNTQPKMVNAFWAAGVWVAALIVGTLAVNSHAAGSLILPWLGVVVHWLHTLGVAFWLGGVAALVMVLPPALAPYEGPARFQALQAVMRRFSRFLLAMVALVVATGIYNALNWFFVPSELATTYGSALGLKILMMLVLLFVGALHHVALRPHIANRLEQIISSIRLLPFGLRMRIFQAFYRLVQRAARFIPTLRLEMVLALALLIGASLLSATPIPEPEFLQGEISTPIETQQSGDLELIASVIPGGPGVNTYDLTISEADALVNGADVLVRVVQPARDWRSEWLTADSIDDGVYVAAGDHMDQEGDYLTLVDVVQDESTTRSVFSWTISNDAAVIQSRPPSLLNLLALVGVILAVLWVLYPGLKRVAVRLDLNPVTLLAAVGATVIAIAFLAFGWWLVTENQRRYEETLWPMPEVVNTVPPDADSLSRGADLYAEHCIVWQEQSRDFNALKNSLPFLRDEELYRATVDGWRDLPACAAELDDTARWDIVNYVRTFERREGS